MFVRTAETNDALEIRRILDGAMLEPGDVAARIAEGDVLVAGDHRRRSDPESDARSGADGRERILGTLVVVPRERGAHVTAVGVRRRHRGRGIGRTLVEHALEREGRLTARFDEDVRPFYDALGFSIEPIDDSRYRGVIATEPLR